MSILPYFGYVKVNCVFECIYFDFLFYFFLIIYININYSVIFTTTSIQLNIFYRIKAIYQMYSL